MKKSIINNIITILNISLQDIEDKVLDLIAPISYMGLSSKEYILGLSTTGHLKVGLNHFSPSSSIPMDTISERCLEDVLTALRYTLALQTGIDVEFDRSISKYTGLEFDRNVTFSEYCDQTFQKSSEIIFKTETLEQAHKEQYFLWYASVLG